MGFLALLGVVEDLGLVAFDWQEGLTAFFDEDPGMGTPAVQGIGRDDFAIQRRRLVQETGCRSPFATLCPFFLVVDGHRLRGAILLLGQGQESDLISDPLATRAPGLGAESRRELGANR